MSRADTLAIQPAEPPTDGEPRTVLENVVQTIHVWHDDTHTGAFHLCQLQPCAAIQDELEWLDSMDED